MILKVTFENDGYEILLHSFPENFSQILVIIGNEINVSENVLGVEFFDVESEKMKIEDDFDYKYFVESYKSKKSLLFVEIDPQKVANVIKKKEELKMIQNELLNKNRLNSISSFVKGANIIPNHSQIMGLQSFDFDHKLCRNCSQSLSKHNIYHCLSCKEFYLCEACEQIINHPHPMLFMKKSDSAQIQSVFLIHQELLVKKRNMNSSCKYEILRHLFGERFHEDDLQKIAKRYSQLSNAEFLTKVDAMFG